MGIWDNLKNRMRKNDDISQSDYDQDYYGGYGNDDAYRDAYGDVYYTDEDFTGNEYNQDDYGFEEQVGTTAPLVSMADIRAQPIPFDRGLGSREDRIPQPVVRERRSTVSVGGLAEDDHAAFRDGLARSSKNSLIELHSERTKLEANLLPEFSVPEPASASSRRLSGSSPAASSRSAASPSSSYRSAASPTSSGSRSAASPTTSGSRSNTGTASSSTRSGTSRISSGTVSPRSPRQVQQLRPQSYADAEAISIGLRQGAAVILDLTYVRPELAKRILDFAFGVTSAFEGQVDRHADRVYILTRNGGLTDAERAQIGLR